MAGMAGFDLNTVLQQIITNANGTAGRLSDPLVPMDIRPPPTPAGVDPTFTPQIRRSGFGPDAGVGGGGGGGGGRSETNEFEQRAPTPQEMMAMDPYASGFDPAFDPSAPPTPPAPDSLGKENDNLLSKLGSYLGHVGTGATAAHGSGSGLEAFLRGAGGAASSYGDARVAGEEKAYQRKQDERQYRREVKGDIDSQLEEASKRAGLYDYDARQSMTEEEITAEQDKVRALRQRLYESAVLNGDLDESELDQFKDEGGPEYTGERYKVDGEEVRQRKDGTWINIESGQVYTLDENNRLVIAPSSGDGVY